MFRIVCRTGVAIFLLLALGPLWQAAAVPQSSQLDSAAVLNHLNQAISWYRHLAALDVTAGQPSDTLYLENARNSAAQALQLAFQSATAEAALLAGTKNEAAPGAATPATGNEAQNLAKATADTSNR
ncbi:MAG TPA: hypothetical protein VFB04_05720, partial [Terriglobales bacterium]|nr:hypothetical protein [Terriglobales bacterium]